MNTVHRARCAQTLIQRVRGRALNWINRASRIPAGHVASPAWIARRLFGDARFRRPGFTSISVRTPTGGPAMFMNEAADDYAWCVAALALMVLRDAGYEPMSRVRRNCSLERALQESIATRLETRWSRRASAVA